MKRINEEFAQLRQQMEDDFLTLMERLNAQKQFIEGMANGLQRTENRLEEMEAGLQAGLQAMSVGLHGARTEMREATMNCLQSVQAVQASQSSWMDYRSRLERALGLVQTSLLTGGIETDSRFECLESRVTRLEDQLGGAA